MQINIQNVNYTTRYINNFLFSFFSFSLLLSFSPSAPLSHSDTKEWRIRWGHPTNTSECLLFLFFLLQVDNTSFNKCNQIFRSFRKKITLCSLFPFIILIFLQFPECLLFDGKKKVFNRYYFLFSSIFVRRQSEKEKKRLDNATAFLLLLFRVV